VRGGVAGGLAATLAMYGGRRDAGVDEQLRDAFGGTGWSGSPLVFKLRVDLLEFDMHTY